MGLWNSNMSQIFSSWNEGIPSKILVLGLDGAGKTTILYKLKQNEKICTIPALRFHPETLAPCRGVTFTAWDIGGQDNVRRLWKHLFQNTQGLIYVVDSNDTDRINESSVELFYILENDELNGIPVLIIANKQDLPNSLSCSDLVSRLKLNKLSRNKWNIKGTCALNGEGIYEAMNQMADMTKNNEMLKWSNLNKDITKLKKI